MSGKSSTPESVKRLGPQSWTQVAVWAVLLVVFATHPIATSKFVGKAVWGAGSFIGYEAFAHCDTPPPFDWMETKRCQPAPAPTGVATSITSASTAGRGTTAGLVELDGIVNRGVERVIGLHTYVERAVTDPTTPATTGGRP
ncbi:MAG: hypothetical protein OEW29_18095 [Acidimicrobiia bacterium]|nr:hypothetical protein [Acidimicrobiia bacterium]MDH4366396.1 hypothetical protein [Acidimicrobiia bacterium]